MNVSAPDGTIALPLESPGDAVNVPGHDTEGTASMQGESTSEGQLGLAPAPKDPGVCDDCRRVDDTDGEWYAHSVQFGAFLCFQCYQRRHERQRVAA